MKEEQDIWIFLSHSNKDYDKVRVVRDKLENAHRRPLMFFLKCLEEDEEVWELIRREIDSRARFVLCKSRNTEDPNGWVQKEFEYIKHQNKPYAIIDLEDESNIDAHINSLVKRSKVFLINSRNDNQFSIFLKDALRQTSYQLMEFEDIVGPGNFQDQHNKILDSCSKEGYVIFIFPAGELGAFQKEELTRALSISDKNIILVRIHNSTSIYDLVNDNVAAPILDVSSMTMQEQVEQIIKQLKLLDISKNY